jgi:predicted enzyme related to lactoylglutathione lyase
MTTSSKPSTSLITGVDLFGYFTSDPQRSIAFYRDVLGIAPTEITAEGRGAEFTFADGTTFGVYRPDEPQSGAAVMFAVGDIDAALARFRERGAQLSEPRETPVCFMSFGVDPDGNTVIIHQRKTGG